MNLNICNITSALIKLMILLCAFASPSRCAFALGEISHVDYGSSHDGFPLFDTVAAPILVATNDWPGVVRAGNDLGTDVQRVTGNQPQIIHELNLGNKHIVIVGTVGRSTFIDQLVREKKIEISDIAGKWESFFMQVVPQPFPGVEGALVICGSDKRGTIYGIYALSEQIGVSPWHFWGDVPPKRHDKLFVKAGKLVTGPPSVKYRGIFLNDEYPALTRWVAKQYGEVPGMRGVANYGHGFYTNIFELMLRIRANYLWPAMWNNAFNEDDPENARLADEYGIVMGTTHQEPMLRAQKEWDRGPGRRHGNWDYNKTNQQPVLQQFWREGIRRNKEFESIITLGLRAENDSGAPVGKEVTEQIVHTQRQILAEEFQRDLTDIPQMWCLYKEVQGYYEDGLRAPDDVTLLWAEDNWGNIRRLPTTEERKRSGGAGVYYHFDYHGGPRSYQWINTSPIPKIWEQMSLAKQYGADRIWIVNVGHFKGYEFPMEFFMRLAWDTSRWTNENLDEYTRLWAEREFGPAHAKEIAGIIATYTKYNGRRKPELLDANTYSLVDYREFERVVEAYEALAARAEALNGKLPQESRDAFYGLVWFPTKACAQLNALYLSAAKNALHAKQGRASANDFHAETHSLFQAQTNLMDHFNRVFARGKWHHFMDQAHIGYVNWNDPPRNNMDALRLTQVEVPDRAEMGISIEGSASAWPGETREAVLPQFDSFHRQSHYIEVFNKGNTPFTFSVTSSVPWILISSGSRDDQTQTEGSEPPHAVSYTVQKDKRLWVSVDWSRVPAGNSSGEVTVSGADGGVSVKVNVFNPSEPARESLRGFVEGNGHVSMEAGSFTRKADAGANQWIEVPDYGHTVSGMRADAPSYAEATPGKDSPCLEYRMFLFSTGKVEVESIVGATLNFLSGRPLRFAVSFDEETPQVITIVPAGFAAQHGNREWEESVRNNCRRVKSTHTINEPGYHTLKIWMVDPAVVVQKLVVNTGGLKPSYLGPPESFHRDNTSRVSTH
jgi:hypothetical protein